MFFPVAPPGPLKKQTAARMVLMSATLQANVFAEYFQAVEDEDRRQHLAGGVWCGGCAAYFKPSSASISAFKRSFSPGLRIYIFKLFPMRFVVSTHFAIARLQDRPRCPMYIPHLFRAFCSQFGMATGKRCGGGGNCTALNRLIRGKKDLQRNKCHS